MLAIQARLCKLYPEYDIVHMPSLDGGDGSHSCPAFVANAAVYGNCFQWHVDADPSQLPPGLPEWLAGHGSYENGSAGKPLFVSLIVYLDEEWRREWDAETLFIEPESGAGLLVQPRPGRAVLMHQDVLHRVSTPSLIARRPRYSLVWKLIFVPTQLHAEGSSVRKSETICRPEWGVPIHLSPRPHSEPDDARSGVCASDSD